MQRRVAIVGAALSDIGRVDDKTPFELHYQAAIARDRRRRPHQGRHRRLRVERHGHARADRDRRVPRAAADVGRRHRCRRLARGSSWSSTRPRRSCAGHVEVVVLVVRLDDPRRPQGAPPHREPRLRRTRARCSSTSPFGHTLISKYAMAARRHMHEFGTTIEQLAEIAVSHALQRVAQPRGLLPRPDHDRRRATARA